MAVGMHRDTVAKLMIDTVNTYAPNFTSSVLGYEALSPLDLSAALACLAAISFMARWGSIRCSAPARYWGRGRIAARSSSCIYAVPAVIPVAV